MKLNTIDLSVIDIVNKSDLENQRTISREEAEAKCEQYNVAYIETSALKSVNIDKAFNIILEGNLLSFNFRNILKS